MSALQVKPPRWKLGYDTLVREFIALHFTDMRGIVRLFPYMKPTMTWKDKDVLPDDVLIVLKNNNEYHGLERHAKQYHVTGQYEFSYHYWLIAALWRRENMRANGFRDQRHRDAVTYDLRQALYNKALAEWQVVSRVERRAPPEPEEFGLDNTAIEKIEKSTQAEMERIIADRAARATSGKA